MTELDGTWLAEQRLEEERLLREDVSLVMIDD